MIFTDVLDPEEADEDGSIDYYSSALDEEDESGLLEVGVITVTTEVETKDVEKLHQDVKYSSLLSYILKPISLLIQGFKNNKNSQEKLFRNMCNFGAQEVWRNEILVVSSYFDVYTCKYQYLFLNPTLLDCIIGYIMEDSVGDRSLKRLPQIRLNLIDGSIPSYYTILNSHE